MRCVLESSCVIKDLCETMLAIILRMCGVRYLARCASFFYMFTDYERQGEEAFSRDGREGQETVRHRDAELHTAQGREGDRPRQEAQAHQGSQCAQEVPVSIFFPIFLLIFHCFTELSLEFSRHLVDLV